MRLFVSIVLALSTACAATAETSRPRPVNVATVRRAIASALEGTAPARTIASMGRVTADRAVVYTRTPAGARQEETWSKVNGSWKLETATPLPPTGAASR